MTGDVLQTREIRAEVALAMQIQVERDHVDKRQVEILGRRVVDVGKQAVGRDRLGIGIQLEQKSLDTLGAKPAHDAGGDFVAEREQQHRRMRPERAHMRHDVASDRPGHLPVVEECDMVRPRHAHHDAQAVLLGQIEELLGHRVCPDRVHAGTTHQREVFGDARWRRKVPARRVRRERAIGHAFDPKPFVTGLQEFPRDCGPQRRRVDLSGIDTPLLKSISSSRQVGELVPRGQGCH